MIKEIVTNFSDAASPILNGVKALLPVVCGTPDSALHNVDPRYIVCITATLGKSLIKQFTGGATDSKSFTVYGFLQDKVVLSASSDWEGLTASIPGNIDKWVKLGDTMAQGLTGRTTKTTLSTRRKWAGSAPISLTLRLKFEAFSSPYREVILPCMGLQGLTLPRGGIANTFGLIPPGPNPFDVSLKGDIERERGENISLDIGGGFLKFNSVIIKNVQVTFENRMSKDGPIGAEVLLTIETYQMLTREDLLGTIGKSIIDVTSGESAGQGGNYQKNRNIGRGGGV